MTLYHKITGCNIGRVPQVTLRMCMSARRQSSSCCISIPTWITSSGCAPAGTGGRSGARGASRRPAAPRWSHTVRFTPALISSSWRSTAGWPTELLFVWCWGVLSCDVCVMGDELPFQPRICSLLCSVSGSSWAFPAVTSLLSLGKHQWARSEAFFPCPSPLPTHCLLT